MGAFTDVEWAILQTIAYADIFDYPITQRELHRYLIGLAVSEAELTAVLAAGHLHRRYIAECEGFFSLAGREANVHIRRGRTPLADQLWPIARHYGRVIGGLPFVRMVAVTGSLAVDNVTDAGDIDYLIVTEPGRLWLARLFVIGLVRWAARDGVTLCPNYFISENALVIKERNLFAAREIAQMVPVSGFTVYDEMRRRNAWTDDYFPNAALCPPDCTPADEPPPPPLSKRITEVMLRTPPGGWLDSWEMNRKIRKLTREQDRLAEADFAPDWCKGHFEGHMRRVMTAFDARLVALADD